MNADIYTRNDAPFYLKMNNVTKELTVCGRDGSWVTVYTCTNSLIFLKELLERELSVKPNKEGNKTMSELSKEQLDKVNIEFLSLKIERMHKEIECLIDEKTDLNALIEVANKILAELDVSNFATGETRKDGTEYHNFNIDQWYARLKASLSQEDIKENK
jgi:hypothetical protein